MANSTSQTGTRKTLHVATVVTIPATGGRLARFEIRCSRCGRVGVEQDYHFDAVAIAERHNEVQGFER